MPQNESAVSLSFSPSSFSLHIPAPPIIITTHYIDTEHEQHPKFKFKKSIIRIKNEYVILYTVHSEFYYHENSDKSNRASTHCVQ